MKKLHKAIVVKPGKGERLETSGISCTFKITSSDSDNRIGIYELCLQPRQKGADLHFHKQIHETFIVLKGTLTVQINERLIEASEGTVVHVPSLVHHAFSNTSEQETKVLLVFNPAIHREHFFRWLYKGLSAVPNERETRARNARYDTYLPDLSISE